MTALELQGKAAKAASRRLAVCSTQEKNAALMAIAKALSSQKERILAANDQDMKNAVASGMSRAMQDRLALTPARIDGIVEGVSQVAALPDPIGEAVSMVKRPNGLTIAQVRVPLGVIAMIYESRPNVTVDSAVLCLKSGNAVILRGGKEAFESNKVLVDIMREAIDGAGLPADCISLVQDTSRESATELMRLHQYVDLLIPRGGAGLIRSVVENATVPVIETGVGNCHVYVDNSADLNMAVNIVRNAKCSRPSVCNAMETLLVARSVAARFLPMLKPALDEYNVELRGDAETQSILGSCVVPATEEDWATEYGDYILAVKVVSGIDEAMEHIARYGTGHSEAIITSDYLNSQRFLQEVDAAAVYVNASTRFTDGGEFGLGAEIGISTQKMHARGPMGLRELTSCKYVVYGSGQIR
ncbi:MAG: glutamate-5-semialdehyde dehydrogenase [Oscillospiraceae bacterium]|jgi:glutamate-5-semialdehyde dehydrogenase